MGVTSTPDSGMTKKKPFFFVISLLCTIFATKRKEEWMKPILNDYHKKIMEEKIRSVESWSKLKLSHEECLNQFKRLREQRIARESKSLA